MDDSGIYEYKALWIDPDATMVMVAFGAACYASALTFLRLSWCTGRIDIHYCDFASMCGDRSCADVLKATYRNRDMRSNPRPDLSQYKVANRTEQFTSYHRDHTLERRAVDLPGQNSASFEDGGE